MRSSPSEMQTLKHMKIIQLTEKMTKMKTEEDLKA